MPGAGAGVGAPGGGTSPAAPPPSSVLQAAGRVRRGRGPLSRPRERSLIVGPALGAQTPAQPPATPSDTPVSIRPLVGSFWAQRGCLFLSVLPRGRERTWCGWQLPCLQTPPTCSLGGEDGARSRSWGAHVCEGGGDAGWASGREEGTPDV